MRIGRVENERNGLVIGDRISIADSSLTRLVGLLGKRTLNSGEGLWIFPSSGVHTFGMKFAIDVIGLDKNLQVIKLWRELAPSRATAISVRLGSVIELPAGRIEACDVKCGDTVLITELPFCE